MRAEIQDLDPVYCDNNQLGIGHTLSSGLLAEIHDLDPVYGSNNHVSIGHTLSSGLSAEVRDSGRAAQARSLVATS